jgi:Glycosyl transferase family 2
VFVLDACSRDHTLQFARAAGARVVQREWTDFIDARHFALAQVETPWTLMIDADESLDDRLRDAIVAASDELDGYEVERVTYFCGKPMRVWSHEPLLRLFRAGRARLEAHPAGGGGAALHERWRSDGRVGRLPGTLLHFSYPDIASYRAKYDRYTTLEAQSSIASPLRLLGACAMSVARFPWLLLAKGAVLDGPRGWYVAWHSTLYPVVTAWKALFR